MKQSAVLAFLDPGLRRDDGTNLATNQLEQIVPIGVLLFDHTQLPTALPFLHLAFASDGRFDCVVRFKPDERFAAIFLREAFDPFFAVLPHPLGQVRGDTDINRTVSAARHNVDKTALFHRSTPIVIPAKAGIQF